MRSFVVGLGFVLATAACGSSDDGGGGSQDGGPQDSIVGGDTTTSDTHGGDAPDDTKTNDTPPSDVPIDTPSTGRTFPDTTSNIAVLSDQLPTMNDAQLGFAASHYVGTEKQLLDVTHKLRALNPSFLVLHYHLSMWQSAPTTQFIVDGVSWGNDYPTVTTHEDWFWHDASGTTRVASSADGKLLMNVSNAGFDAYWADSLAKQVAAGEYDAIFFDSASPALLQGECGAADPRLAGTAAATTTFSELGGKTWIAAWEAWITSLNATLAAKGIPLLPNTSAFVTGWDTTDYSLSAGAFVEGYADPSFVESDWKASTNELLKLSRLDKIMILQNYLSGPDDVAKRFYYLGNYLLVKGKHTYLDYFAAGPLEWYPEWTIDLGAPVAGPAANVDALASAGVYRRDFAKGSVLVNPSGAAVTVPLGATMKRVVPSGGGAVDATGAEPGSITTTDVTTIDVAATSAEILLK
jgi:hypothetical protein